MSKRGRWRDRDELPVVFMPPSKRIRFLRSPQEEEPRSQLVHSLADHTSPSKSEKKSPKITKPKPEPTTARPNKMELEDEDLVPQNILHSDESTSKSSSEVESTTESTTSSLESSSEGSDSSSEEAQPEEHLHHQPSDSDESTLDEPSSDVSMEDKEEQKQKEVEVTKSSRRNPKPGAAPIPSKRSSIQIQNDPADAINQGLLPASNNFLTS